MPDPTPSQLLGKRVRAARHARGMSIVTLGTLAGTSTKPVEWLEHGKPCNFDNAARICAALGIPLDEPEASDD